MKTYPANIVFAVAYLPMPIGMFVIASSAWEVVLGGIYTLLVLGHAWLAYDDWRLWH